MLKSLAIMETDINNSEQCPYSNQNDLYTNQHPYTLCGQENLDDL